MSPLDRHEEAALVARCAQGDAASWEEFVDRFGPLLVALARRMLLRRQGRAQPAEVDDVVAEVFLALLRRDRELLRRFDPAFRLSTYLGVITRTQVRQQVRRRCASSPDATLERAQEVAARSASSPGGLEAAQRGEDVARLREALLLVSPRDRLLLTLRYLDDLDYQTIAGILEVSPESIGPLLQRARLRLRRHLTDPTATDTT